MSLIGITPINRFLLLYLKTSVEGVVKQRERRTGRSKDMQVITIFNCQGMTGVTITTHLGI